MIVNIPTDKGRVLDITTPQRDQSTKVVAVLGLVFELWDDRVRLSTFVKNPMISQVRGKQSILKGGSSVL
jgi:hypothetical protein